MCSRKQNKMSEYQLRQAAGKYWLLHMEQKGVPYERPLQLNQMGAELWKLLQEGKTTEQVIKDFVIRYDVPEEEIRDDVMQFRHQLAVYGVLIEE